MVIKNVNLIPASFVEISPQSDNDLYSRATLDVFYVGETADHRKFTKEFSDKLLETIAYTPVVSHYNEETDDFEGHAAEQEIYGLVDPMTAPQYVERDGATWARCSVILYTKRPDKVGEIASKIVGHPQSLELRPDTLKYKINRDAWGNFKNLEFLEGQFIGVSVLGKDQEPAFTGSGFFEALPPEVFSRGKEMTLTIHEFAKLSWGEKSDLLFEALYAKYGEGFWTIWDIYNNSVVYSVYDEAEGRIHMYRMKYEIEGDKVSFTSEPEAVHPSYEKLETLPEAEPEPEPAAAEADAALMAEQPAEKPAEEAVEDPLSKQNQGVDLDIEEEENAEEPEEQPEPEPEPEPNPGVLEAEAPIEESGLTNDVGMKGSHAETTQEQSTTSALSDAERLELEAYRKEKKIGLIASYSDMVAEAELKELVENVDNYEYDALKNTLDALYVAASRKKQAEAPVPTTNTNSFKWYPTTAKKGNTAYSQYIGDLLNK